MSYNYLEQPQLEKKRRFFIAILPPSEVQDYANQVKQHFATTYHSKAALRSPPHITLQPPFEWEISKLSNLETVLTDFAQTLAPIPIILEGFSAFCPRVIYINVHQTPELLETQKKLLNCLESSLDITDIKAKSRTFHPHLTVGFRDLTKANFYQAWEEFQHQKVYFSFFCSELNLLIHDGKRWQVKSNFACGKE